MNVWSGKHADLFYAEGQNEWESTHSAVDGALGLKVGIARGFVVPVFEYYWPIISSGIPIVVTRTVVPLLTLADLQHIWNEYQKWRTIEFTTLGEEQLFSIAIRDQMVGVVDEDSWQFTIGLTNELSEFGELDDELDN